MKFTRFAIIAAALLIGFLPVVAQADAVVTLDGPTLQARAESGDVAAQDYLGSYYTSAKGGAQDYDRAVLWFTRAAEQGDAFGESHLADLYARGAGVPRDYTKAAVWYYKAAVQGDAPAQYALGNLYYAGRGVEKSQTKAVDWFLKAADRGHAQAQQSLKIIYARNVAALQSIKRGTPIDYRSMTTEQVNSAASSSLGIMYLQGAGAAVSMEAAFFWIILPLICMLGLFGL